MLRDEHSAYCERACSKIRKAGNITNTGVPVCLSRVGTSLEALAGLLLEKRVMTTESLGGILALCTYDI